jgi:HEAT repeat protein
LGDPAAIGVMIQALKDTSKIVRWRAARFLYEVGDETAISALREALNEPEFEIRMQVSLALERIEGGEAAVGSVWQQMTNRTKTET